MLDVRSPMSRGGSATPSPAAASRTAKVLVSRNLGCSGTRRVRPWPTSDQRARAGPAERAARLALLLLRGQARVVDGGRDRQRPLVELADNACPGYGVKSAMLFCGDDAAAKAQVAGLIDELGWEPLDVGGHVQVLHPGHMTLMWVRMVRAQGHSPQLVWAALRR